MRLSKKKKSPRLKKNEMPLPLVQIFREGLFTYSQARYRKLYMPFAFASMGIRYSTGGDFTERSSRIERGEKPQGSSPASCCPSICYSVARAMIDCNLSSTRHTHHHSQVRSMAQLHPQGRLIPYHVLLHVRPPLTLALELHVKVPQHACHDGAQFEIRQTGFISIRRLVRIPSPSIGGTRTDLFPMHPLGPREKGWKAALLSLRYFEGGWAIQRPGSKVSGSAKLALLR